MVIVITVIIITIIIIIVIIISVLATRIWVSDGQTTEIFLLFHFFLFICYVFFKLFLFFFFFFCLNITVDEDLGLPEPASVSFVIGVALTTPIILMSSAKPRLHRGLPVLIYLYNFPSCSVSTNSPCKC